MKRYEQSGKYLRKLRLDLGLTQADLASILGCNSQFISNWERGLCAPPPNLLKAFLKQCKASAEREYFAHHSIDIINTEKDKFKRLGFNI